MNKNGTLNEHTSPQTALKEQSGGNHYLDNAIQPIEYIVANKLNFIDGNIVKYAMRAGYKYVPGLTPQEAEILDLQKAQRYIEMRINQLRGETEL